MLLYFSKCIAYPHLVSDLRETIKKYNTEINYTPYLAFTPIVNLRHDSDFSVFMIFDVPTASRIYSPENLSPLPEFFFSSSSTVEVNRNVETLPK